MTREVRNYTLKLYDQELIKFTAQYNEVGEIDIELIDYDPTTWYLWPLGIDKDNIEESLVDWVRSRTIPKNRQFVDSILNTVGLTANDNLGIIDICKGLSINDSFWLDDGKTSLSFNEINLFDNELDEALAIIAYTGYTPSQKHKLGLSTEWTSNGQYPKAWRRIDNRLVLYKAGTTGYMNAGMEPYSEFLAAQVAERLGIKHVSYNLEMWKGKLASTCELLNNKDISYVPFAFAAGDPRFPAAMAISQKFSKEMFADYEAMTLFDALVCNPDRHGVNFGVLRDNQSGQIIGLAPLFDHNQALFPYLMEDEFDSMFEAAHTRYYPRLTPLTFKEQVGTVMSKTHHDMLRKLIGFNFKQHDLYPIPDNRLKALNIYLEKRTEELLEVPVVDQNDRDAMLNRSFSKIKIPIPMLEIKKHLNATNLSNKCAQSRVISKEISDRNNQDLLQNSDIIR